MQANSIHDAIRPRPVSDWHEDYGDVLWWVFPINEPPYCGQPLDSHWPGYHTHWTPLIVPYAPNASSVERMSHLAKYVDWSDK